MSGEPHYLSHRDIAYWQSRPQHKSVPGARPTLGDPRLFGSREAAVSNSKRRRAMKRPVVSNILQRPAP
jgi:hypothetical protein